MGHARLAIKYYSLVGGSVGVGAIETLMVKINHFMKWLLYWHWLIKCLKTDQ